MRKILIALLLFLSPLSFAQEKVSLADISLKTLDNQTVTLSQYQDKPLYIKMWASWCPICLVFRRLPPTDERQISKRGKKRQKMHIP